MFPDNLTREEARRRSELLQTHAYAVVVDLSGRQVAEPETQFVSTSTVRFTARGAGDTHLDLIGEAVREASLDGTPLDPTTFAGSRLPFAVEPGEHELTVVATCRYSRSGDGLHRFVDPADGRTYLYTQFEAADARRMYACFEQPDLKARFSVTVVAPADWTVVGNGTIAEQVPDGAAHIRTRFTETLPISTYLTALVAGHYARVDGDLPAGATSAPMAVYCRQSMREHLDADQIFAMTRGGFEVFERHFGVPYPFGKYDQVFVPEYNAGAMENVGLVVLRDDYLFRSRPTQAQVDYRRDVVLHELSHMWFGDLVTMRWWDDLWLKESFATWASNFATSEQAEDPARPWAAFCSGSKTFAYRADQLPSTHPVAADIVDLEAAEYNFDQITYSKGASVLLQLVAFVGRDAFLAGLRDYFARHAYGNTELPDLLASLQQASGRDLSGWAAQWLETAGANTLRVELDVDDAGVVRAAEVVQTAPPEHPALRDHRVALGVYRGSDGGLARTDRLELDVSGARTPVPELVGQPVPDAVVPNDDDLTYAKVRLDDRSRQRVLADLPTVTSALSRAVLWGAVWDACRDAELAPQRYLDLVLRGVAAEDVPTTVRSVLAQAGTAAYSYVPPAQRADVQATWEQGVRRLLDGAEPGSDVQLALSRTYLAAAGSAQAADALAGWLADSGLPEGLRIDTDLRWAIVHALAWLGRLDEAAIEAERQRDDSINGAQAAAGARAARPTAAAKAAAWRLAVESDDVPNSTQQAICLGFWQRDQDEVLAPYVDRYLATVEDISAARGVWERKGLALRTNVLRWMFPWPTDQQAFLERLDGWLAGVELSPSVARVIAERRDDTVRALRCQAAAAARS